MANEHQGKGPEETPITIDQKPFKVTNPVKGSHLYSIGSVGDAYELWLRARGDGDDEAIAQDDTEYTLDPGAKLYTVEKSLNPGR